MKKLINEIVFSAGKIDRRKVRFLFALLILSLLVLGAGAPGVGGGVGGF